MILSDTRILEEIEKGTIKIVPYDRECLGSNSYDVHLGKHLAKYVNKELDAKAHNTIEHFDIPEEGFVLQPHEFYLGVTDEYTETHAHVAFACSSMYINAQAACARFAFQEGNMRMGFCVFIRNTQVKLMRV